jgi:CHASE2 domain-containing sensor protein
MSSRRRAALLVLCLLAGTAVGACGYGLTGSQWWFAAIPAAVAGVWLAVANPERCVSGADRS